MIKSCAHCKQDYQVAPARAPKSRFCSKACFDAHQTGERQKLTCVRCGAEFIAARDHGLWPKFCSRDCFLSDCVRPQEKTCASCGCLFVASRSSKVKADDGPHRKYCSNKCRYDGLKRGKEATCVNCGAKFYMNPAKQRQRKSECCCSHECQVAYYRGKLHPSFKSGSYIHKQLKEKHLLMPRPGYVGKYMGEHRIIASRAIGRLVTRSEYVIRINRNPKDNRPENLFICASNSEFAKRRLGSLPWPGSSNLADYELVRQTPKAPAATTAAAECDQNHQQPECPKK